MNRSFCDFSVAFAVCGKPSDSIVDCWLPDATDLFVLVKVFQSVCA